MKEIEATGVMVLLFALRCVVPLLFTIGIGYLMNRLVDHWEAEEQAAGEVPAPQPAPQPALTTSRKEPALNLPCWILRNCDADARASCPGAQSNLPCWIARMRADGALPANCPDCPIYQRAHPALA